MQYEDLKPRSKRYYDRLVEQVKILGPDVVIRNLTKSPRWDWERDNLTLWFTALARGEFVEKLARSQGIGFMVRGLQKVIDLQQAKRELTSHNSSTDCRSPEGIDVVLVDTLINSCRLLRSRILERGIGIELHEAFLDLHDDEDVQWVLQAAKVAKEEG
jgi:hypothetical protein